jgi:hypothetical protein
MLPGCHQEFLLDKMRRSWPFMQKLGDEAYNASLSLMASETDLGFLSGYSLFLADILLTGFVFCVYYWLHSYSEG